MTERTDWQLIQKYVQEGGQAAFSGLVRRHTDLVYCTCLREIGDPALAEDATQAVFLILARKSRSFRPGTTLSSWLFQTALLTSKNVLRRERRRQAREQRMVMEMAQATPPQPDGWEEMEPLLNNALHALPTAQRGLVLERFLEDHPLAEIGAARGISEDAARMRLNRALDRLRRWFAARNVVLPAAALAALLPLAVRPAPAHCAESLLRMMLPPGVSPTSEAPTHALAQGAIHTMTLKRLRLQLGAAALVAALSLGTAGAVRVTTQIKARAVAAEKAAAKRQDQARALAVLDRMYATYAVMHSFRCDVANRTTDGLEQVGSYKIERPYKIRFERATLINTPDLSGKALAVSDGNSLYVTCSENGGLADRYAKIPLSHSDRDLLWDFGGLPAQGNGLDRGMPGVAFGERIAPYGNMEPPEYSLGKPTMIGPPGMSARMVDVVVARLSYPAGTPARGWKGAAEIVTFYIGQSDHLLFMLTDANPLSPTTWSMRTESYSNVQVNPALPASDFVFTPPPGSHEVRNASGLFPGGRL